MRYIAKNRTILLAVIVTITLLLAGCDRFGSHKDSNESRNPEEQPPTGSTLIPPKQPEDPFCPDRFSNIIMLGSCVHIENSSMFISRDGLVQYLQAHIDTDALANNEKCWAVYWTALEHLQDRDITINLFPVTTTTKDGSKLYGSYIYAGPSYGFGYGWSKETIRAGPKPTASTIIHEVAHHVFSNKDNEHKIANNLEKSA